MLSFSVGPKLLRVCDCSTRLCFVDWLPQLFHLFQPVSLLLVSVACSFISKKNVNIRDERRPAKLALRVSANADEERATS